MSLEENKKLITRLMKMFCDVEINMTAQSRILTALNHAYPEDKIEKQLEDIKQVFQFQITQKYRALVDEFLAQPDESSLHQAIVKWTEGLPRKSAAN